MTKECALHEKSWNVYFVRVHFLVINFKILTFQPLLKL